MTSKELVLVTGGSGFIGSHTIIQCLAAGYRVRTTIRSLKREEEVREMLRTGKATNLEDLSFVEADLTKDEGWKEAVQDCKYVLHVASPFPPSEPKDENELIIPARDGTLRVLRAARDAHVKRVVMTSSFSAVHGDNRKQDPNKPLTEEDWTDLERPGISAYNKSKTLAERAAWEFIKNEGGELEMAAINPCTVAGPVLAADYSLSIEVISRLMNGAVPGCPNLPFGFVDVRDVVGLHLLAMTSPKADGERFLCMAPPQLTMKEISLALREHLGDKARRCPTRSIPDFVIKLMALFDPSVALVVPMLGQCTVASVDKAKNLLGWIPRSNVDAVVATGETLWELGLVKK
ncbi:nucleoside-diphosphate-sugar epimerase [Penicillium angulare]|uniref:Nucleoside-diphosphate-sugar epimerase n=1 Tax=Penicillium angulare TaxID=116970 RepID=A0A9W9KRZ6_9EURO|nr:nucleoside-diphosphate-sugar epimerase [Penicillium angulare]